MIRLWFHSHSLQARIVFMLLVLMLSVQLVGFAIIQSSISNNAQQNAHEELRIGERVFNRLLTQNGQRLSQAVQVLSVDTAFREALANNDQAAILSTLQIHANRNRADMAVLLSPEGDLVAETAAVGRSASPALRGLIYQAERSGMASSIDLLGGEAYQIVVTSVRAPLTAGWIVMGFAIDEAMLRDLAGLTGLELSIAVREEKGSWRLVGSTLGSARADMLRARLADVIDAKGESIPIELNDEDFETHYRDLGVSGGLAVIAILQRSLTDAAAAFLHLQAALLILTAVGLIVSIAGSVIMARRITQPLRVLADAAHGIAQGDYSRPVQVAGKDEIAALGMAFNHMREGISARETRISELAYGDVLTGLPNRALFKDRLEQAVEVAQSMHGCLAVLSMDVDRFKDVNDTLGHQTGDLLLQDIARRLRNAVMGKADMDMVARLGGDEFAILLPGAAAGAAQRVAKRILETFAQPASIDTYAVDAGMSIGIALYPDHADNARDLVRNADIAMYSAKRGGSGFTFYDPRHDQSTPERLSLLSELRQAIEQDHLAVFYQPKLDLHSGKGLYVEALVRWRHPQRGFVTPEHFIPFAEQTGYIKKITAWMLNVAFRQCATWRLAGLPMEVSINISARDLHNPDFTRDVVRLLESHAVDPRWICLEITESAVMEDPLHALDTLERLHAMGFKLSIDDFGTGYSSLAYLKKLPVDELKIDKSFVKGLVVDSDDAAIVRSTIDLAHNMGLTVSAEGVEEAAILEKLRSLGCDTAQGYFISRPLAAAELDVWMSEQRKTVTRRLVAL